MTRNRIWISGADGKIGKVLQKYLDPLEDEVLATDKYIVDIVNSDETSIFARRNRPNIIINCSALTDPVACQENPDEAFRVNALGARNMAVAANTVDAKIIHMSADDVFSGQSRSAYREYDTPHPTTMYGKSKLMGENFVREFSVKHFILRTSWLFSPVNHRVEDIIKEAIQKGKVYVPKAQYSSPTSAYQLAEFIVKLMATYDYGIYHASCEGVASRKEFAEEILRIKGIDAEVIEDENLRIEGHRPDFTALENFLLNTSQIYKFTDWQTSLQKYIEKNNL